MGLVTLWMAGGQDWPKLFRHYDRRCRGELDGEEFRRAGPRPPAGGCRGGLRVFHTIVLIYY